MMGLGTGTGMVMAASAAFVGTHFLLSHPWRRTLVRALGDAGFLGLYSAVAAVTLGWMAWAYRRAPADPMLWPVGDTLWAAVTLGMLVASVLLVGSLIGNPALPDPTARTRPPAVPHGVFTVTRHPMLWSFALWGLCHILVYPAPRNIVVALAILVLALVGAAAQDAKKSRLDPDGWPGWRARTSYWPFAAVMTGRARLCAPGWPVLAGGTLLWLAATWAHGPLAGWSAGIWRWFAA